MKTVNIPFTVVVALVALWGSATASGQEAEKKTQVDPSGTWRWEHDMQGATIKDVLKLNLAEDGKVVGTYQGDREPVDIESGKIDGDKLSFQFDIDFGQIITIKFAGKVDKDQVDGNVTFESDQGAGEFPWSAKRSVELSDVEGVWKLRIDTPDGNRLEPVLTVTQKDKEFQAVYTNAGSESELSGLQVKNNRLEFRIKADYDGNELVADFKGRPYGDKISGSIDYEVGGEVGAVDFTGKREAPKKK